MVAFKLTLPWSPVQSPCTIKPYTTVDWLNGNSAPVVPIKTLIKWDLKATCILTLKPLQELILFIQDASMFRYSFYEGSK